MKLLLAPLLGISLFGQSPSSLKLVPAPQTPGLDAYVRDSSALLVLGKAFFWDMQAGSDGRTACASCHFHAGADHRVVNQLSNALAAFPASHTFTPGDFPFHALTDVNDNGSAVLRDSSNIAGSAGVFARQFSDISGGAEDSGLDSTAVPSFASNGVHLRQVTRRNTPSVINAVYNYRNFWDGRASNVYTGRTPFGPSDAKPNVLAYRDQKLDLEAIRLTNASLASQAVGPALNSVEMSYAGRTWEKLGQKILALRPLALQRVSHTDSVLGLISNPDGTGLALGVTYLQIVQLAFRPEYWSATQLVDASGSPSAAAEFTQAQFNFPIFWGLAIQAYEATLVSDDSPFDRLFDGSPNALSADQQNGFRLFGNAECATCHARAEFTAASVASVAQNGTVQRTRRSNGVDTGFFRTGVRPASDDVGLGADDDFGVALASSSVAASIGAFKTPGLRNVELTGPFFHDGSQATLEHVVDFYMRGGDFPAGNLGPDIQRRNVSVTDRNSLVNFLKSLTDDRVRFERAPFDHPELCVPHGIDQEANPTEVFPMSATDLWVGLPPVGSEGNKAPLQTFAELLAGVGSDGSREHSLTEACAIKFAP